MVPTADRQKATVLVRIGFDKLDDPRILPDMGVKVTFLREADDSATPVARAVSLIPKSAVRTENDESYVFVVRQDTVERRAVRTAGADGDRVEVLAGCHGRRSRRGVSTAAPRRTAFASASKDGS